MQTGWLVGYNVECRGAAVLYADTGGPGSGRPCGVTPWAQGKPLGDRHQSWYPDTRSALNPLLFNDVTVNYYRLSTF